MKKIFALILSLSMLTCIFAGCKAEKETNNNVEQKKSYQEISDKVEALEEMNELDKNMLVYVDGVPMSEAAVRFAVISTAKAFDNQEEIDREIKEFYLLNAAIINEAEALGVELDDDSFEQNVEAMQVYYKQALGDDYASYIEENALTPYFLYLNQCYNVLFGNIFSKYTEDPASEMAVRLDENTIKEVEDVLNEGNFVRAKHILIQFPEDIEKDEDGNIVESAKEETKAKANEVLAKVNAMSDPSEFDALVEEYGEDPGMESYPAGYYFTEGEMVEPFEKAAYALEEYGISGLVETSYGYHIIQRLPYDSETYSQSNIVQTYSEIYDNYAVAEMREILLDKAKDYEIIYDDKYNEVVEKYENEYKQSLQASGEAE